jgi:hypothetical protein
MAKVEQEAADRSGAKKKGKKKAAQAKVSDE